MNRYMAVRPRERHFEDLFLCYAGYEQCAPLYAFGPTVRPNYLLHLVLSGRGIFRSGEYEAKLGAGEGFLILPGEPAFYQADRNDPWAYLWLGFGGTKAPSLIEQLGLGDSRLTFRTHEAEALHNITFRMFDAKKESPQFTYFVEGQLCLFFSELIRDISPGRMHRGQEMSPYVQSALTYIQNHYREKVSVQDLADRVGVNRSYLYSLFLTALGMGPSEYLQMYRLSRAADLLSYSDDSIEFIALSSGYRDPRLFSKAFKLRYGMTPTAYRRS